MLFSARGTALGAGFAGLLLLMAVMAVDSTRSLASVEATTASLRKASRDRDGLLDQLRADIYRSATVARDYLLELDDGPAQKQKAELELIRTRMNGTLRIYEQDLPATERNAYAELRGQVEYYWSFLAPALEWNAAERRELGVDFLRNILLPGRAQVVELAKQVTGLNERDLEAGEERIQAVLPRFRQRITITFAVAVLLGVLLAGVTLSRVRLLERAAEGRYKDAEEARRELRKLSDRLVAAQEEERRSLSRELHDEVGQSMSAVLVELGRLEAATDSEVHRTRLSAIRQMAEASIGVIRNMALLLRPPMLDDLGLVPAMKWQAREVTRRTGLRVKIVAGEIDDGLPDSLRTCVYRVVQEALNNCARHSQGTEVSVAVRQNRGWLSVFVRDNGIGFDPRQEKGLGFLGMEERVERLGGHISIESQPGHGTLLSVRLPCADKRPVPLGNLA